MTASKTTALKSAKDFDVDAFMSRYKPYRPEVRLHRNGELKQHIDALAEKIAAAERSAIVEESLADEGTIDDLIAQHDALVEEFEVDVEVFVFRAAQAADWAAARAAVLAEILEGEPEPSNMMLLELMYPHMWAATVIEPAGMPVEAFQAIRDVLGDGAIAELQTGWSNVANGGVGEDESAPFSRKPWRIPAKQVPAPDSE